MTSRLCHLVVTSLVALTLAAPLHAQRVTSIFGDGIPRARFSFRDGTIEGEVMAATSDSVLVQTVRAKGDDTFRQRWIPYGCLQSAEVASGEARSARSSATHAFWGGAAGAAIGAAFGKMLTNNQLGVHVYDPPIEGPWHRNMLIGTVTGAIAGVLAGSAYSAWRPSTRWTPVTLPAGVAATPAMQGNPLYCFSVMQGTLP